MEWLDKKNKEAGKTYPLMTKMSKSLKEMHEI
jgi:hypothetical protein